MISPCVTAGAVNVGEIMRLVLPQCGFDCLCKPKSNTLTVPSSRTFDIRRLEIAMDNPLLVRGLKRLRHLPRYRQRLIECDGATGDLRARSSPSMNSMTSARTLPACSRPWI